MLTNEELEHYRDHGWVVQPNFVGAELPAVLDDLRRIFPTSEEYWAAPDRFPELRGGQFDSVRTIPTGVARLDRLPFDPRVRAIAEQVTRATDLRLMRGGYQSKFTGAADFDQILHLDYTNHTLVVLPDEPVSTMVGFFAYFTDVTEQTGPTMAVSRSHARHLTITDTHLERDAWPEIYVHERALLCPAGALLVYDYRLLHRGSALTGAGAEPDQPELRFRRRGSVARFLRLAQPGRRAGGRALIADLAPDERALLGFPPLRDTYWTDATIDAVSRRYPGFDPAPYREAQHAT